MVLVEFLDRTRQFEFLAGRLEVLDEIGRAGEKYLLVAGFSGVRIRLNPAEMTDYSVIT